MKTLEDVLEEITPAPDPDFVADMERRMRRGFPPRQKRRLPRIDVARFSPRQVTAVATSVLLALLVAVGLTSGGSDGERPATEPAIEPATAGDSAPSPETFETTVDRSIAPPSAGTDVAPGAEVRRIERTAQLTLASEPDEFDGLAGAIFRTADRRDGFVLQSSFTQGEDGFSGGFFELRIPSTELQPALNELSRLATVRARSESGTDITGSFVSIRDRLRTAKALRTSLLRRLELAVTDSAVTALRRRLEIVGNRIGRLRDQLSGVRERTRYATVFVELVDEDTGVATGETDEAIDDAVGSLEDLLNFLIRAAGILVPLALAGGIGWLGVARARRRARARALA